MTGQYRGGPLQGQDATGRRTAYRSETGEPIQYRRSGDFNNLAMNCHWGAFKDDQWYERVGDDYVHTTLGGDILGQRPARRAAITKAEYEAKLAGRAHLHRPAADTREAS